MGSCTVEPSLSSHQSGSSSNAPPSSKPWAKNVQVVRKKIRRGGVRRRRDRRLKKDIYTRKELEIYHLNIRGLDSKIVSLKGILKTISPDIVTLNETHYVNKRRINIEGYEPFQRNRIGKGGGGIATLVKKMSF